MDNLKQTSLFSEHKKLNAKFAPFAGWEMPIQYSSVKDETIAVRTNVGVFDVSHMGEFFVEGDEAQEFVDFMITNDFKSAAIKKAVYSPLCKENGTVIDDLICYKLQENKILICVNASNIEKDYTWFEKHAQSFNVKLSNQSDDFSLLAIQGPKTAEIMNQLGFNKEVVDSEYYSAIETELAGKYIIAARTGYTGEDGFEIFANHQVINNLWIQMLEMGVTPCGLAARDVLRLEVGYPLYGHELSEELTPLDAGLKWAVKLNKINFIGKNALAESKPKYQLIKISLEKGIPREGYEIIQKDKVIGKVTSGTMSVTINQGIAMALVERENFEPNDDIFVNIRNKQWISSLNKKPFVAGGHK